MFIFLALLRVLRAVIGLVGLVSFLHGCSALGGGGSTAGDVNLGLGVVLLVLFAILRWIINIPYVRLTGVPGIEKFWGL